MLNIETTTKLAPEETIKRAVKFFGPQGYGLEVKEKVPGHAAFEGGGGYVALTALDKGKGSTVTFESREWDYQVKEFISKIK